MPTFKLPLSGDVMQNISPWTAFMSPMGNQLSLVNVTVGQSSEPAVEADVLSDVAGYGKQLGRIEDALVVLLAHFRPVTPLTKEETEAIDDLKEMIERIADAKEKHKRKVVRPRAQPAGSPAPLLTAPTDGTAVAPSAAAHAPVGAPPPLTTGKPSRRSSKSP